MSSFGRLIAAFLVSLVLVGGPVATQLLDNGCSEGMVRREEDCLSEDTLIVLADSGTRMDVEAAIAPHGGRIFGRGAAGVYTVIFPGARYDDLAPIMQSMKDRGFTVYHDRDYSMNSFPLMSPAKR